MPLLQFIYYAATYDRPFFRDPDKRPRNTHSDIRHSDPDFFHKPKHVDGIIDLPIILEPNSNIDGRVEFPMGSELQAKFNRDGGFDWLKYWEAAVYVKERRSGKTKKIMVGESYDAAREL